MGELTKSLYTAGVQCHKLLWLKVHEKDAEELQPDIVLNDRFQQGYQVERLARERFEDGVLIDRRALSHDEALTETQNALASGVDVIFEASFQADGVFVAVDILVKDDDGHRLIEVKSASSYKDKHLPDVAVQCHVLRACGVNVTRVEVMHLNKEHRHPDIEDLFATTPVPVDQLNGHMSDVPDHVRKQLVALEGPCPEVAIGEHCFNPYECPFRDRCWPDDANHIKQLVGIGPKKAAAHLAAGVEWISDLPDDFKYNKQQARQLRAMQADALIVEPGLAKDLEPFQGRLGFLDFETIVRAMPVWPGMAPWGQAAAQFSYHEIDEEGKVTHEAFLAEGPEDARPALAEQMLEETAKADGVVVYSSFEKTQIGKLAEAFPQYAGELEELKAKLLDLLPVVRNNVYHPGFRGSFSIKYVLNPLVPDLSYDDLVIVDGLRASVEIARMLFVTGELSPKQHEKTRYDLLEYCKRDTWATVRLLERLRELAP